MGVLCVKDKMQRVLAGTLACCIFLSGRLIVLSVGAEQTSSDEASSLATTKETTSSADSIPHYTVYRQQNDAPAGTQTIVIPAVQYTDDSAAAVAQICLLYTSPSPRDTT